MTARGGFLGMIVLVIFGGTLLAQQPTEESVRTAADAYRRMWQAMTPEQRKNMVDAGGGTPERYERTLRIQLNSGGPKSPAAAPAAVAERETKIDVAATVQSSVADLNTVRDANLMRLREEACPPEIALEVAALRSRQSATVMPPAAALLALADSWFLRPAGIPSQEQNSLQQNASQPIDVLLGVTSPAKPAEPGRVNAEIERLLVACKR